MITNVGSVLIAWMVEFTLTVIMSKRPSCGVFM